LGQRQPAALNLSAAYPSIKFVFLFGSAPATGLLIGGTSIMCKK